MNPNSRNGFKRGHKYSLGRTVSEATKEKISKALKGKRHSPLTEFKKGHSVPKKWRDAVSKANLKGDNVAYRTIHSWLSKRFGKADRCEQVDCEGKSKTFDWSKLRGKKYERKRENFWKLCRSCHIKYDRQQ